MSRQFYSKRLSLFRALSLFRTLYVQRFHSTFKTDQFIVDMSQF